MTDHGSRMRKRQNLNGQRKLCKIYNKEILFALDYIVCLKGLKSYEMH